LWPARADAHRTSTPWQLILSDALNRYCPRGARPLGAASILTHRIPDTIGRRHTFLGNSPAEQCLSGYRRARCVMDTIAVLQKDRLFVTASAFRVSSLSWCEGTAAQCARDSCVWADPVGCLSCDLTTVSRGVVLAHRLHTRLGGGAKKSV